MIGKTLAHYEILSELGKGGMGEVYRARDTKLGRDVALKLLPPELADDPERIARFGREARTLASIQHANIAAIYGFEHDGERHFLIMELVEGLDLSERLAAGRLSVEESLKIAAQIAEGLEVAHETGIVHRDLKPANIMLGKDGAVKILDFGLARAYLTDEMSGEDAHNSPTITAAMTQAGTILGTAAYMSPEQARGRQIDRRADIWSFGVILYEMLSGQRLFEGETISDTLAAVLRAEPDWDELPTDTPPALRKLLRRCLTREPRERLRDAGDARIELSEILAHPRAAAPEAIRASRPNRLGAVAPWLLVVALAAALGWRLLQSPTAEQAIVEFDINPPVGQAMREFSVSPDGSKLCVVSTGRNGYRSLWLREFDKAELRELPGTADVTFPFWSPDSRSIAFFAEGKLRRLDLANENVQSIADAPNGRGGAWSSDDIIVFTPEGEDVLYRVPARGGTPEPLTEFQGDLNTHRFPHFVPGSQSFTFCAHADNSAITHRYFRSMGSDLLISLPDGMSESYPTAKHLLFVREGDLVAQRFDPATGLLSGEPYFLASEIADVFPRTGRSAFSVSTDGVLAYLPNRTLESRFTWHDGAGLALESSRTADQFRNARLSHDRRLVSFIRAEKGSGYSAELWVHDLARGSSRKLQSEVGTNDPLGWTDDDRALIYPFGGKLWRHDLEEREPELLLDVTQADQAASLSAISSPQQASDGSFIIFSAWDSSTDFDLWILHAGDSEPQRLIQGPNMQARATLSPDDEWIAYVSQETGRGDVYVCGITPPASGKLISSDGGRNPIWSEDGSRLYYLSPDDHLMAIDVRNNNGSLEFGLPRLLFRAPPGPGDFGMDDFFSRPELLGVHDGKFLFLTPAEEIPPRVIKVVLNWEKRLGE